MDSELRDLALLLGMFAGDGCLPIKHNGQGYRNYQIAFYNTNKSYVVLFSDLFFKLFKIKGKIFCRKRENRKPLWSFEKYSKELAIIFNERFEIPFGKKARNVFIPSFIKNSSNEIKMHFFLGLFITDGGLRKDNTIIFHSASKKLISDLRDLFLQIWAFDKPLREYNQRGFLSYQINLNRKESRTILESMPRSHNLVLRRF